MPVDFAPEFDNCQLFTYICQMSPRPEILDDLKSGEPRGAELTDPRDLPGPPADPISEGIVAVEWPEHPDPPLGVLERIAGAWRLLTKGTLYGGKVDNSTTTQSGRRKIIALVVGLVLAGIKLFGADIDVEIWADKVVDLIDVLLGIAISVYGWFSMKQAKASADQVAVLLVLVAVSWAYSRMRVTHPVTDPQASTWSTPGVAGWARGQLSAESGPVS